MRLFSEGELKIYALGTAALLLISLTVAIAVSVSRNSRRSVTVVTETSAETRLDVADLAVPDEYRRVSLSRTYVFRPRLERWNVEQIERYWIDPTILQLDELRQETDELIQDLFDKVP